MAENQDAKYWEDKVTAQGIKLEEQHKSIQALTEKLTGLTTELSARETQVNKLEELVSKYEANEAERKVQAQADFVDQIRQAGVEAQAPIAEEDLEKVREAFQAGHEKLAHHLGETFVRLAKAQGGKAFSRDQKTQTSNLQTATANDGWGEEEQAEFNKRWFPTG